MLVTLVAPVCFCFSHNDQITSDNNFLKNHEHSPGNHNNRGTVSFHSSSAISHVLEGVLCDALKVNNTKLYSFVYTKLTLTLVNVKSYGYLKVSLLADLLAELWSLTRTDSSPAFRKCRQQKENKTQHVLEQKSGWVNLFESVSKTTI